MTKTKNRPNDPVLSETEKLVESTLAAKPFYRPEMGPALVAILDSCCQTAAHRRRVCAKAMEMFFGPEGKIEDRCPGPAELRRLCAEIPAGKPRAEASPECPFCEGIGFEQVVCMGFDLLGQPSQ